MTTLPTIDQSPEVLLARLGDGDADSVKAATGAEDPALALELASQVHDTLAIQPEMDAEQRVERVRVALAALRALRPQNEIEGLLAVQMIGVHNAAVDCLTRAARHKASDRARDDNLRHAERLLALFARQLDTLHGNQSLNRSRVSIGRVEVKEGGQAIVGAVDGGGWTPPQEEEERPDERW